MIVDYRILFPEAGHPKPETFQGSFIIIQAVLVDIKCLFRVQDGFRWPGGLSPAANSSS